MVTRIDEVARRRGASVKLAVDGLQSIAETTLANATAFETGSGELHQVTLAETRGDRA